MHLTEEMHNILRACQERQVAQDDDAVETVVYQCQQAAEELGELFDRARSEKKSLRGRSTIGHGPAKDQARWDCSSPARSLFDSA